MKREFLIGKRHPTAAGDGCFTRFWDGKIEGGFWDRSVLARVEFFGKELDKVRHKILDMLHREPRKNNKIEIVIKGAKVQLYGWRRDRSSIIENGTYHLFIQQDAAVPLRDFIRKLW